MREVRAKLRYYHRSGRKVRQVADLIRGQSLKRAKEVLSFAPRASARELLKLLASAEANATHNFGLQPDNLFVREIRVDEGPSLKRFMPRAFGRAAPIRKRTSHVLVVLADEKRKAKSRTSKSQSEM